MYKYIIIIPLFFILSTNHVLAIGISEKLSGKILLQTEQNGEAWYIYPQDKKRYYLGSPQNAFNLMQKLGIGITNNDLFKIPIGITIPQNDNDHDGIDNKLELILGTNPDNADTDNDGYNDKQEIENNYDPLTTKKNKLDTNFTEQNLGKIFIQTEQNGEAWYIYPQDKKRYYLGNPTFALQIMKELSLGITDNDIKKIQVATFIEKNNTNIQTKSIIYLIADAIKKKDIQETNKYFSEKMHNIIKYTIENMNQKGITTLSNILSTAKLIEVSSTKKTYTNTVHFNGEEIPLFFYIEKENNHWVMTNL